MQALGPPSLMPALSLSSAPESPGSRVGPHHSHQPLLPPLVLLPLLTDFFSCVNASFLSVIDVCSALIFPLKLPTHSAISLLFYFFPSSSVHEIWSVLVAFHALCSTRPNLQHLYCVLCIVAWSPVAPTAMHWFSGHRNTQHPLLHPQQSGNLHSSSKLFLLNHLFEWNFLPFGFKFPIH